MDDREVGTLVLVRVGESGTRRSCLMCPTQEST
jgi:hypothetical protein